MSAWKSKQQFRYKFQTSFSRSAGYGTPADTPQNCDMRCAPCRTDTLQAARPHWDRGTAGTRGGLAPTAGHWHNDIPNRLEMQFDFLYYSMSRLFFYSFVIIFPCRHKRAPRQTSARALTAAFISETGAKAYFSPVYRADNGSAGPSRFFCPPCCGCG